MPVCLACQDFLLLHTALRKGNKEGIPRAEATTAKARAVVLRTYSSMLSISGLIVEIIVANPAACQVNQAINIKMAQSKFNFLGKQSNLTALSRKLFSLTKVKRDTKELHWFSCNIHKCKLLGFHLLHEKHHQLQNTMP